MSATAGTIFHGTRTPLTVWFAAGWQLVSGKIGISAIQLQREMQLGSYQTALFAAAVERATPRSFRRVRLGVTEDASALP